MKTLNVVETEEPKFAEECDRLGITHDQMWNVYEGDEIIAALIIGFDGKRTVLVRETADDYEELVSLKVALKDPFDVENVGATEDTTI